VQKDKWTDTIDLQVLFFRFTLDSATEFLFGESVDSQITLAPGYKRPVTASGDVNSLDFAGAFDRGQMVLAVGISRAHSMNWTLTPNRRVLALWTSTGYTIRKSLEKAVEYVMSS